MEEGPKTISLEALFRRLSQGELLEMTENEREQLYAQMSQDDIVRYYQAVSALEVESRREILAEWTPRPKILYHASHHGDVELFEPRAESKRQEVDPPLVFSSPLKAVSSMFLIERSSSDISGSYDGGKTWIFTAESLDDLKKRNRPGFIYSLPTGTFQVDPYVGLGLYEWTSERAVAPSSKDGVDSALEAMMDLGVHIYVPSDEVSMEEFRNGDQATLLKKMQRIIREDI